MTEHEKIIEAIYRAVDVVNGEMVPERRIVKDPQTRLFGPPSALDSLNLVAFIVAIERQLEDAFDVTLTLADERALSLKNSPFSSIHRLADHIEVLLKEAKE